MPVIVPVSPVIDAKTSLFHVPKTAKLAISNAERQNVTAIANFVPITRRVSGSKLSFSPFLPEFLRVSARLTQSVNGSEASFGRSVSD
jgi:hypothetical protein